MQQVEYTVYWTEEVLNSITIDADGKEYKLYCTEPKKVKFNDLNTALGFAEYLRKLRREGEKITAVTMVSENPDSVGQAGVDVTGPDYDWKKRRP